MNRIITRELVKVAQAEVSSPLPPCRIKRINGKVLSDWDTQWDQGTFSWPNHRPFQSPTNPMHERFGFAFYVAEELCGLVAGSVNTGLDKLRSVDIALLEGSTSPFHPLRGRFLRTALIALETIGNGISAHYLRAHGPVSEVFPLYKMYGYEFVGCAPECNFFGKRLDTPHP